MVTASTMTVPPRHVETLEDWEIHAMLDVHLFLNGRWCYGHSQLSADGVYRCQLCKAVYDPSFAELVFGEPHPRLVPRYGVEEIWQALRRRDRSTQTVFELMSRVALSRYLAQTTRTVAVCALQALGVIDAEGFLKGSQDREEAL